MNLDRSLLADWAGKAAFLLRLVHERLFERLDDGRQVKAARAILGLTASELAKASGLSKNSVLRVEGMKRLRRYQYDRNSSAAKIERVIGEHGIHCEMQDGYPSRPRQHSCRLHLDDRGAQRSAG